MFKTYFILSTVAFLANFQSTVGLLDKLIKGGSSNCDCPCRDYWTVKCTVEYETQCKPHYTHRECTKVPKQVPMKVKETECQKCVKFFETVLETKNKRECLTVYDEQCDTQYPAQCSTEQQCTMLYQTVCNTVGYSQKCNQVPKQNCIPVKKCHRTPQTNCKPVQRQKCGKVPVKVPKRVQKHTCLPFEARDNAGAGNCGSNSPSSSYWAPSSSYGAPSSSYGAPSAGYGPPTGSLQPPSQGYNPPSDEGHSHSNTLILTPDSVETFDTFPAQGSYGVGQSAPDSYGTPIAQVQSAPDSYGTPIAPIQGSQDSYGSPTVGQSAPDSYGNPLGSILDAGTSFQAPDVYGAPSGTNNFLQSNSDSYGSPQGSSFQSNSNSYGSPSSAAADLYVAPQDNPFRNVNENSNDVSIATIRVVNPPVGSNPFLSNTQGQPIRQQSLTISPSQGGLDFTSGRNSNSAHGNNNHQFVPEFIPSVRLPDNFSPDLGSMILHTTDRATLLNDKKMKFPEDHDYGEINNVLNNQAVSQIPKEPNSGEEAEFEEDEEEGEEEEYEDEDVERVPASVGKIGRALDQDKKVEDKIPDVKEPPKSTTEQPKVTQPPILLDDDPAKTNNHTDSKTLEKVLESLLAEVEETDEEEVDEGLQKFRRKKKRRIPSLKSNYGRKLKTRKSRS